MLETNKYEFIERAANFLELEKIIKRIFILKDDKKLTFFLSCLFKKIQEEDIHVLAYDFPAKQNILVILISSICHVYSI